MNVKFSLIVPIYNVQDYLEKCLHSLAKQDYQDFEIILVNDGSTDSSRSICEKFVAETDNAILIDKKNGGLSSARNRGLQEAANEYIWFIDSDDWIDDKALSRLSVQLSESDIDLLGFSFYNFTEETGDFAPDKHSALNTEIFTGPAFLDQYRFIPMVCMHVYRKEFIDQHSLTFNESILHEDVEFSMRCYSVAGKIKRIPDPLYFYRKRSGSIMAQFSLKRIESVYYLIRQCSDLQGKGISDQFLEERKYFTINAFYKMLISSPLSRKEVNHYLLKLKADRLMIQYNSHDSFRLKIRKLTFNLSKRLYYVYMLYLNSYKDSTKEFWSE